MNHHNTLPLLLLAATILISCKLTTNVESLPLSTKGRYIIDSTTGNRVKLRCVNWASHMPVVVPEGLDRRPVSTIASTIASLGFNCVRLTWATHMFTQRQYENLTVNGSMVELGLTEAVAGMKRNNEGMVMMRVREAFEEVVGEVGKAGLMVVLDNHVSKPQWCCGADDGNGFFGDLWFDADEWLRGLVAVAKRFRGVSQVVGMSTRNELRGANQSKQGWYEHVTRGARAIHAANPDVLVVVSGLSFDSDLSFLSDRPLALHFDKLVYEAHWYSFSEGKRRDWAERSPNHVCPAVAKRFEQRAGFMLSGNTSKPLFISEFGVDQRGVNRGDNRFLSCFLAYAADKDVDWAMWALQGTYYRRNGRDGFEETYGVLNTQWDGPKIANFRERFGLIQDTILDPESKTQPHQIIYHPLSGKCLSAADDNATIFLSDCRNRSRWSYKGQGTPIRLANTALCLSAESNTSPVRLTTQCESWKPASNDGFQFTPIGLQEKNLCLHWNSTLNSSLVHTKECICLEGLSCDVNPQTQWFTFVTSNIV